MRRHIMHDNYDRLKIILSFEGIKKPADVNNLVVDKAGYVDSLSYPWIKNVYEILFENNVAAQTELAIWGSDPGQYFQINRLNCINKYQLSKFSCFFPGRTIISAGDIKKGENVCYIQRNTLFNFFFSDIISENDLGLFTPNSINGNTLRSIISESNSKNQYRIADLDIVKSSSDWAIENNPVIKMMYVGLPWLYNARVEDYIDLINQYENEFENYNSYVRELAKVATNESELTQVLVNQINDLKIDLNIKLDLKKEELKKKGITAVIGVCLTGIPFLISSKYIEIDPNLLSTLVGGASAFECAKVVGKSLFKNNLSKENPLWVIWKWSQKTQKTIK